LRLLTKEYIIIKVRYYASPYLLKKYRVDGVIPKQQYLRAKASNELFWNLVQKALYKSSVDYFKAYYNLGSDCAQDDLYEELKIARFDTESSYVYLIPKHKPDIAGFLINEANRLKLPVKVLKKIKGSFYHWKKVTPEDRMKAHWKAQTLNHLHDEQNKIISGS
jgi:hypothetical protein